MVRIIRQGAKNWLKEYRFSCSRCGCIFVANENEYKGFDNQREGFWAEHDCPNCDEKCVSVVREINEDNLAFYHKSE